MIFPDKSHGGYGGVCGEYKVGLLKDKSFTLFIIYLLHIKYSYNLTFYNMYDIFLNKLIDEDKKKTPFFCLFNKM